jgi:hypothetical protein
MIIYIVGKTNTFMMTTKINSARKIYRRNGLNAMLEATLRYFMTQILVAFFNLNHKKISVQNGVAVRYKDLLDPEEVEEDHEEQLIRAIRENLDNGEKVALIGGGHGASTVACAHQIGKEGQVIVYEGAKKSIPIIKETARLNCVEDRVRVKFSVVEEAIMVYGDERHPEILPAKNLPEIDSLVMDCEGAELSILENMGVSPDKIIVETHGHFESPTSEVKNVLRNKGYIIESEYSRSQTIDILTAMKD